jgi:hypothetical protein
LARIKIIGNEKCIHINKKTGIQDCDKLGRINPKPVISWNNKRKFDRNNKRQYVEFIHNDGTSHILGKFNDYRLNQMKGNPFEDLFKALTTLASVFHDVGNLFYKIAEASLKWNLTDIEKRVLVDASRQGDFEPIIKKYKQSEYKRRRQIYDDSKKANIRKFRKYSTLRSQVDDDYIDRNARNLLNLSLLGLSREDLELQLYKLTEEESIKVYERYCELVNAFEIWLYDRKELFKQVAREKGYKLPEPKRKMSIQSRN